MTTISQYFCRASKRQKILFSRFFAFLLLIIFSSQFTVFEEDNLDDSTRAMVQIRPGLNNMIRTMEFNILGFLSSAIDYFQNAVDEICKLNLYDFVKDKFSIDNIYPLAWTILSLSVVIAGIFMVWHNDKVKISDQAKSIIMSALLIVALPTFFSSLNDMRSAGISDVKSVSSSGTNFTLGEEMLMKSIIYIPGSTANKKLTYDESPMVKKMLEGVGKVYEAGDDTGHYASYAKKNVLNKLTSYINLTASHDVIAYSVGDNDGIHKLEDVPENEISKIIKSIETLGYDDERAYMYFIDFWFNIVLMSVTIVCLVISGVKLAGLLFDLVFMQIVAPLIVASDVSSSGRTKKIIQNVLSTYIIFIIVFLLLRLYIIILLSIRNSSIGNNIAVLLMITIAGAKFVIDGPDLVVQILGIDAGVKSGMSTLLAMQSAARMTTAAVSGTSRAAKNIVSAPAKVTATAADFVGKKVASAQKTMSSPGFVGKVKSAVGNSHVGQAFKQGYSNREHSNNDYADLKNNYVKPSSPPISSSSDTDNQNYPTKNESQLNNKQNDDNNIAKKPLPGDIGSNTKIENNSENTSSQPNDASETPNNMSTNATVESESLNSNDNLKQTADSSDNQTVSPNVANNKKSTNNAFNFNDNQATIHQKKSKPDTNLKMEENKNGNDTKTN